MFTAAALAERLAQNRQSLRFALHGLTEGLPRLFTGHSQPASPYSYAHPTVTPHGAANPKAFSPLHAPAPIIWSPRPVSLPHRTSPKAPPTAAAAPTNGGRTFLNTCKTASNRFAMASIKPLKLGTAGLAVVSAVAIAAVQANFKAHEPDIPALRAQLKLRLAEPVLDGEGVFIGVRPPEVNEFDIHLDNVGSALTELPESCYQILTALEDSNANTLRYVGGIDYGGFFNVKRLAKGHGMSSLPMQLSSLATGAKGKLNKYARKSQELAFARVLLTEFGGHRGMATAYASIAPYAIANADVRGLHNAAAALYGVSVESLNTAQCAILMSLPKAPFNINGANPALAWQLIQHRAAHGLEKVYGNVAQADIAVVKAMPMPKLSASDTLAGITRRNSQKFSRPLKFENTPEQPTSAKE